jgi:hypothetical protein
VCNKLYDFKELQIAGAPQGFRLTERSRVEANSDDEGFAGERLEILAQLPISEPHGGPALS